jgi:hypothetical protein
MCGSGKSCPAGESTLIANENEQELSYVIENKGAAAFPIAKKPAFLHRRGNPAFTAVKPCRSLKVKG